MDYDHLVKHFCLVLALDTILIVCLAQFKIYLFDDDHTSPPCYIVVSCQE